MRKAYYLSTCSTCNKILKQIDQIDSFDLQDIKTEKISESQIEEMHQLAGSFEVLFSRRAMKFRSLGLHLQQLNEEDYKRLILEEYTFLKRPVFIIDQNIFIGSAKGTISQLLESI